MPRDCRGRAGGRGVIRAACRGEFGEGRVLETTYDGDGCGSRPAPGRRRWGGVCAHRRAVAQQDRDRPGDAAALRRRLGDGTLRQEPRSCRSTRSPDVQHAVLAAEDRGFYTEPGISPKGIARALFTNVRAAAASSRAARRSPSSTRRTPSSPRAHLHPQGKEVFIALKMSADAEQGPDPRGLPQHDLLRPRGLRHRGRARDLLRHGRRELTARPGRRCWPAASARPAGYDPAEHPERAQGAVGLRARRHGRGGLADRAERDEVTLPEGHRARVGRHVDCPVPRPRTRAGAARARRSTGSPRTASPPAGWSCPDDHPQGAPRAPRSPRCRTDHLRAKADDPRGALVSVEPGHRQGHRLLRRRNAGGFDYAETTGKGVQPGRP